MCPQLHICSMCPKLSDVQSMGLWWGRSIRQEPATTLTQSRPSYLMVSSSYNNSTVHHKEWELRVVLFKLYWSFHNTAGTKHTNHNNFLAKLINHFVVNVIFLLLTPWVFPPITCPCTWCSSLCTYSFRSHIPLVTPYPAARTVVNTGNCSPTLAGAHCSPW